MLRSQLFAALLSLGFLALAAPRPASAGCGCDHPTPDWSLVMPPYGSPGRSIQILPNGGSFRVGRTYKVDFGGGAVVEVKASDPGFLMVKVPAKAGEDPGPKALKVQGTGYDREYDRRLFTALPPAHVLPASGGRFALWKAYAAVDAYGTMLLPLDARAVRDPMQLAVHITSAPLTFGADDVGIQNVDGFDLTLFTVGVDGQTDRQWGSYYGWRVEGDNGLYGDNYDPKVLHSIEPAKTSDVLSYWRHEFHTYAAAHGTGGTHTVDAAGRHRDGTLHVEHGQLVLAISPLERNPGTPSDVKPLQPGRIEIDLVLTATRATGPLESIAIQRELAAALASSVRARKGNEVKGVLVRVDGW